MKSPLYSSAILLALSVMSASQAMDPDERVESGYVQAQTKHNENEAASQLNDEWKKPFYTKPHEFSNPRLDMPALNKAILIKDLDAIQIKEILSEESARGNEVAQEKLYGFYTKQIFGIDLRDETAADSLLEQGLTEKRTWALWAKAQQFPEGKVTKWHCLAANRNHPAAKTYVEKYIDYNPEMTSDFLVRVRNHLNNHKKRDQAIDEFIARWEPLNYARPFLDAWLLSEMPELSAIKVLGPSFLRKAVDWLDVKAVQHFEQCYAKDLPPQEWVIFLENALLLGKTLPQNELYKLNLATMYTGGLDISLKNHKRALELYLDVLDQNPTDPKVLDISLTNVNMILDPEENTEGRHNERVLQLNLYGAEKGFLRYTYLAASLLEDGFDGQSLNKRQALELYLKGGSMTGQDERYRASCLHNAGCLLESGFEGQSPNLAEAFAHYSQAAALGHIKAGGNAALLLYDGFDGQPADPNKAIEWMKEYADKGDLYAIINTADHLMKETQGHKPDKKQALQYYLMGAKEGNLHCIKQTAILLWYGFEGHKPDKKQAFHYFKRGADLGALDCIRNTAEMLKTGLKNQKPDKKAALHYYLLGAKAGDSECILNAAYLLQLGFEGQEPDKKAAYDLLMQGVEQSDPECMARASILIYHGWDNQPGSSDQALALARKAAALDSTLGLQLTGESLTTVKKNPSREELREARECFEYAIQLGHYQCYKKIGAMWKKGQMEEGANINKAIENFKKGAEHGDLISRVFLGMAYSELPDPKHVIMGFNIILDAARLGNINAMAYLGEHYLGTFLEELTDIDKALFWLEKAASRGNQKAKALLEKTRLYQQQNENFDADAEDDLEKILNRNENKGIQSSFAASELEEPVATNDAFVPSPDSTSDEEEGSYDGDSDSQEDDNLDLDDSELEASCTFQPNEKKVRNVKFIREQLRQAGIRKQQLDVDAESNDNKRPTQNSLNLIRDIQEGKAEHIDRLKLENLFSDPFFNNQVIIGNTKSGICVVAHNRRTDEHFTTGTHRKHTKHRKGHFDPAFFNNLKSLFALFDISADEA